MDKLISRIDGGGGGGCPVLVFGITSKLYVEDPIPASVSKTEGADDE